MSIVALRWTATESDLQRLTFVFRLRTFLRDWLSIGLVYLNSALAATGDEAKEGLEETSASAPRQERVIPAAHSPPPPPPPDRYDVLEKLKHLSAISASARAALLRSDEVFTHNLDALQLPEEDEQPEPVPLSVQKPKSSLFGAWGDSIKSKSIADKAGDAADEKDGKGTHTEDLTVSASTADKKDGKGMEDQAAIDDADTAANLKLIAEQKAADDAARAAWEQAKKKL
eukprot:g56527.t1